MIHNILENGPYTLFVLGAPDAEMAVIKDLISASTAQCGWAHATDKNRRVVNAGNAYKAAGCGGFEADQFVLVECGFADGVTHPPVVARCDHHNPGDPGFGLEPSRFLEAASVGQVYAILHYGSADAFCYADGRWWLGVDGAVVPEHVVYAAAADHCLGAAYAGQCPGVNTRKLRELRVHSRASFLADKAPPWMQRQVYEVSGGVPESPRDWLAAVDLAIRAATVTYRKAPTLAIGDTTVYDLRELPAIPELPEALAIHGDCAIYRMPARPGATDPRTKVGIIGAGLGTKVGAEPVAAFLNGWATDHGLVDLYGDPARGFAGGYEHGGAGGAL